MGPEGSKEHRLTQGSCVASKERENYMYKLANTGSLQCETGSHSTAKKGGLYVEVCALSHEYGCLPPRATHCAGQHACVFFCCAFSLLSRSLLGLPTNVISSSYLMVVSDLDTEI